MTKFSATVAVVKYFKIDVDANTESLAEADIKKMSVKELTKKGELVEERTSCILKEKEDVSVQG